MKLSLSRTICFLFTIAVVGISVTFAGCDLGTYQQRLDERNSMENETRSTDDDSEPESDDSDSESDDDESERDSD